MVSKQFESDILQLINRYVEKVNQSYVGQDKMSIKYDKTYLIFHLKTYFFILKDTIGFISYIYIQVGRIIHNIKMF